MERRSVGSGLAALIGLALMASPAHAAVETFSFTSGSYSINGDSGPPYIDAGITGTFSGVVESDGYIRLADLVSFEATVFFNDVDSVSGPLDLQRSFAVQLRHPGRRGLAVRQGFPFEPEHFGHRLHGPARRGRSGLRHHLAEPDRPVPLFLDQCVAVDFRPGRHGLHHSRPDDHARLDLRRAGAPDLGADGAGFRGTGIWLAPARPRLSSAKRAARVRRSRAGRRPDPHRKR